jgi:NADP-dependent alcohol dehydrogenase
LIEVAPKVLAENPAYEDMANYMWAATVALNGWISTGVAQDWATHAIGHEITALHGIDHARTLAVVLPHLMAYKKDRKWSKIVQYGKRVWDIKADADQTAELAIEKTVAFFESLGIPSKASAYGIGEETIAEIEKRFAERNLKIGEHGDISAEDIRKILEMSIS